MNLNDKKNNWQLLRNHRIPEILEKDFSEFLIQFLSNKLYLS